MRNFKKGILAAMILGCVPALSACSFNETLGILWNSEDKTEEQSDGEIEIDPNRTSVDANVELPTISNGFGQAFTYYLNGAAEPMTVEAVVSDGGTLSYQWYRNNVDSNGGGTAIQGATESSFVPPSDKPGISYYYVVVTNTLNEGVQLVASGTNCVTILDETDPSAPAAPTEEQAGEEAAPPAEPVSQGSWQTAADGGEWYLYADGTYPVSKWEEIDGFWYIFDGNGYIVHGWYLDGDKWYYFGDNGAMARDTTVDGYYLGPNGEVQ